MQRIPSGAHAVKVRCLHSLGEIAALRPQINALNMASARPDPFSTFEFYDNLLRRSGSLMGGERAGVWFLAAFTDGELIGYLALEEVTEKVLWRRIRRLGFLVAHSGDRPHVVARPEHVGVVTEMFYEYLQQQRREWEFLELQQQDAASTLYPLPPGVDFRGWWVRYWPNLDNGTIRVRWNTLQEYAGALAPRFRSNLKRQFRNLFTGGEVALLTSSDPASTPALLDLYCSIEKRSWKSHTDLTIGGDAGRLQYVRGLLDAQQPMGIVIQILILDGAPVAGLISGSFAGPADKGLYALHMAFDARLSLAGPGSALLMMGMRYAIDGRYAFLNLLSGFGYYKTRWLAEMTPTRCLQIYRIGGPCFWRRVFGDGRRWIVAHAGLASRWLTPRITAIDEQHDGPRDRTPAPLVTAAERADFAVLIAEARQGDCEWLANERFAAAMPFAVDGPAGANAHSTGYAAIPVRPAAAT
jgi:hypothetical protein